MHSAPQWVVEPQEFDYLALILRLSLAAILGGVVGFERELSGHPAGLRTNILIATSSCLFTLLSIHAFPLNGAAQDTARVAAQIVTGVGFLGAGTVIHTKGAVYGLTTAATIWMVAAVGMAVATDMYLIGIITTMMTTGILIMLAPLSYWLAAKAEDRQKEQQIKSDEIRRKQQQKKSSKKKDKTTP
jgi:putative Mg2+ transporter-C (MgtC) family protein